MFTLGHHQKFVDPETMAALTLASIEERTHAQHLAVFGAFHPEPQDGAPDGTGTLILLGPHEPEFWAAFSNSPEYLDGQPDPINRWSVRVIEILAMQLDAVAVFPFGGPPYAPFIGWAKQSGRAWESPVNLLVHDVVGLFVSYRGAIALRQRLSLPEPNVSPCPSCVDQPCLQACPVGALVGAEYDLDACHTYLNTGPGQSCMEKGCEVRRACPISQTYNRQPQQSAFHMKAFHP